MVEVKKKRGETFEALFRRFGREIQRSGLALQARKIRYHKKDESRNAAKTAAARRDKIKEQREYQKKIGILDDDPRNNR